MSAELEAHPWFQYLRRWQAVSAQLEAIKAEEAELRRGLFSGTFPKPTEGVNTLELPTGEVLKGTYKLTRTLDTKAVSELLSKKLVDPPYLTKLQRIKIELDLKAYKALPENVRQIIDAHHVVVTKPGMPTLQLIEPKADDAGE